MNDNTPPHGDPLWDAAKFEASPHAKQPDFGDWRATLRTLAVAKSPVTLDPDNPQQVVDLWLTSVLSTPGARIGVTYVVDHNGSTLSSIGFNPDTIAAATFHVASTIAAFGMRAHLVTKWYEPSDIGNLGVGQGVQFYWLLHDVYDRLIF